MGEIILRRWKNRERLFSGENNKFKNIQNLIEELGVRPRDQILKKQERNQESMLILKLLNKKACTLEDKKPCRVVQKILFACSKIKPNLQHYPVLHQALRKFLHHSFVWYPERRNRDSFPISHWQSICEINHPLVRRKSNKRAFPKTKTHRLPPRLKKKNK